MDLSTYKFLVVDDHALLRHVVTGALRPHGVKSVDWAPDGNEALNRIKTACAQNSPYDVVFLDWNMPVMNGFEVLSTCRSDRQLDKTAIIMLTAESETHTIIQALEAGATAYITKPFQPEMLIKKLEDVVAWRQKMSASAT